MPVEPETLGGAPLFSDLEPALLERIAGISVLLMPGPGERLFNPGDRPPCLYPFHPSDSGIRINPAED